MTESRHPATGDGIVVSGHRVGERERHGEIVELLGDQSKPHYRVRWDDGHESIFYPADDAHVLPVDRESGTPMQ